MKFNKVKSTLFATGAFCGFFAPVLADLSEVPGEGIYFCKAQSTVFETEIYPDFLLERNGKTKTNFKVAQLKNDVFICPKNGPQIPIQLSGYELLEGDTLKTGVDSRVVVYITPSLKITLGEKTIVKLYKINKKFFLKVVSGNIRILSSEEPTDTKYYFETEEFISEITKGDFVTSVSRTEGSSIINISGYLTVTLQRDLSVSFNVKVSEIYTLIKNAPPKSASITNIHQNFIEDKLNFEFEISNQGSTINALLNRMTNAPQGLLTRLSLTNLTEKEKVQLYNEVTEFLMQGNSNLTFKRHEAEAVAKLLTQLKNNDKKEEPIKKTKFNAQKEEILKDRQTQALEKAKQLKDLEEKLIQEAKEAEEKAKAIK